MHVVVVHKVNSENSYYNVNIENHSQCMVHFHLITLFPESIEPYLKSSILGRALEKKKINITFYNPKDFIGVAKGKARVQDVRVDRRPYGGGPGMVLRPEPLLRAAQTAIGKKRGVDVIFFSTDGEQFTEEMAQTLAGLKPGKRGTRHIVFICGHYEGVDARVPKILKARHISIGPYVLTGGELPAVVTIDAIARFIPGVLGKAESLESSRIASPEVYTRPDALKWKGKEYSVPQVLKSGHHGKIEEWKKNTLKK